MVADTDKVRQLLQGLMTAKSMMEEFVKDPVQYVLLSRGFIAVGEIAAVGDANGPPKWKYEGTDTECPDIGLALCEFVGTEFGAKFSGEPGTYQVVLALRRVPGDRLTDMHILTSTDSAGGF
tara:strand:+ start:13994 stop:14359 length:366 start_codon:yes stop_codon:yes gene_type:complete